VQRTLRLRTHVPASVLEWYDLEAEDYLARFLRTLEVGEWEVEAVHDRRRFGWEARMERQERAYRATLMTAASIEQPPPTLEWTLTVESEADLRAPPVSPGGEWWIGALIAVAGGLIVERRAGPSAALVCALALLLLCGLGLPRVLRRGALDGALEPAELELLERLRHGAEQFASFELLSPDWQ
jgi:hypothetical protein